MLKSNLLLALFLMTISLSLNAQENTATAKTISGKVTYLDAPIPDVNIIVKGTSRGTRTDNQGYYEINARVGEEIQFSHVSYKTVSVIVEDVTNELFIEMIDLANELDEVVVVVKSSSGEVMRRTKAAESKFESSRGSFDPKTAGYAVGFVDGSEINVTYPNIKEALRGKLSGYSILGDKAYLRGAGGSVTQDYPAAWEVDGVFSVEEPVGLDLSQIKSVYALKGLAATNKYGTQGAGGVIIIQTYYGSGGSAAQKEAVAEKYRNQNFYSNDAFSTIQPNVYNSNYVSTLESLNDKQKAFEAYQGQKSNMTEFSDNLAAAQTFYAYYKDPAMASDVLMGLKEAYKTNPETLKAIAYQLQHIGMKWQAIETYKDIARLRPKYAQSYRDLANAYVENEKYLPIPQFFEFSVHFVCSI